VLKKILPILALLYTIALAIISLLNFSNLPDIDIDNSDKYGHAIAYSLLCLIWYLAMKSFKFPKALLIAASIAIIYGIVLEVLQGALTDARIFDGYDILANSIGVAFISIIILIRNKTQVKNL